MIKDKAYNEVKHFMTVLSYTCKGAGEKSQWISLRPLTKSAVLSARHICAALPRFYPQRFAPRTSADLHFILHGSEFCYIFVESRIAVLAALLYLMLKHTGKFQAAAVLLLFGKFNGNLIAIHF